MVPSLSHTGRVRRFAILIGGACALAGCGQDERPPDEAVLDGSTPLEARTTPEGAKRSGAPGGAGGAAGGRAQKHAGAADEEKRIRGENKRLRRELEDLEALERARKRIQRQLAKAGYDSNLVIGAGGLAWPVNGTVSSPFGPRWGRLHAGSTSPLPPGG